MHIDTLACILALRYVVSGTGPAIKLRDDDEGWSDLHVTATHLTRWIWIR